MRKRGHTNFDTFTKYKSTTKYKRRTKKQGISSTEESNTSQENSCEETEGVRGHVFQRQFADRSTEFLYIERTPEKLKKPEAKKITGNIDSNITSSIFAHQISATDETCYEADVDSSCDTSADIDSNCDSCSFDDSYDCGVRVMEKNQDVLQIPAYNVSINQSESDRVCSSILSVISDDDEIMNISSVSTDHTYSSEELETFVDNDRQIHVERSIGIHDARYVNECASDYESGSQGDENDVMDISSASDHVYCRVEDDKVRKARNKFWSDVNDGPVKVCTVCHRMLYKSGTRVLNMDRYLQRDIDQNLLDKLFAHQYISADSKIYICHACDRAVVQGKIPCQSLANNLALCEIPQELRCLNDLETHLISKRICFLKMYGLPRGKQCAISGPAINIPTHLDPICHILPRLPAESSFVHVRLKRRLVYKSHYMANMIRPDIVMKALYWLKDNNPLYSDIVINDTWQRIWETEEGDFWQAALNTQTDDNGNVTVETETQSTNENNDFGATKDKRNRHDNIEDETNAICEQSCNNRQIHKNIESTGYQDSLYQPSDCNASDFPMMQTNVGDRDSMENLKRICNLKGLTVLDVNNNGDCLFESISLCLNQVGIQEMSAASLRNASIMSLRHDPQNLNDESSHFKNFVAGHEALSAISHVISGSYDISHPEEVDMLIDQLPSPERLDERWERYLDRMSMSGTWGDHLCLQALANFLCINFSVTSTVSNSTIDIEPRNGPAARTIKLGLIGQNHYTGLITNTMCNDIEAQDPDIEDIEEFRNVSALRGLPFETCLQREDICLDENKKICVAPGEGEKPKSILGDELFEEMCFFQLYPKGRDEGQGWGGVSMERPVKITPRKYFNQRLLNIDGRFAQNIEYIFASQYTCEEKDVADQSNIAMRKGRGHALSGTKLNAGNIKDDNAVQRMINDDVCYKFLKQIRGTPVFWQSLFHDIVAMMRQLGKPTFFLTLSCADMKWPSVIKAIAAQHKVILSDTDIENMSYEEKCEWLRKNPVCAARHFEHRVRAFFREFLIPSGVLGDIEDYVFRVEMQQRGSPHIHCIIWVKDAPLIGVDSPEDIEKFVNEYVKCNIPDNDDELARLVKDLQCHSHTKASPCQRNGKCRFKFPRPPCERTVFCDTEEDGHDMEESINILKKVMSYLHKEGEKDQCESLDDVLKKLEIEKNAYMTAVRHSTKGRQIILKRECSEMYVNNYNADILKCWQANMDLQYMVDHFDCVMYVAAYVMKAEKGMSELLKAAARDNCGEELRQKMKKISSVFLNHREVSAQEAVYRILSLPLKKCTRQIIFVNTASPERRTRILKPRSILDQLDDQDTDIFQSGLNEKYINRPFSLENMCLAEFAAWYGWDRPLDDHDDQGGIRKRNERIVLLNNMGKMMKRNKAAIIRFPNMKKCQDTDLLYRSKIMLYIPFRNEQTDLLDGHETFFERYSRDIEEIRANEKKFNKGEEQMNDVLEEIDENGIPELVWETIQVGNSDNEGDHEAVIERNVTQEEFDENTSEVLNPQRQSEPQAISSERYTVEEIENTMTNAEYRQNFTILNKEQRDLVIFIRKWCKQAVIDLKAGHSPKIFTLFLSGAGGCGKSHTLRLVKRDIVKFLRMSGRFDLEDKILCTACPTGTAAYLINGVTLHQALGFGIDTNSCSYTPPSFDKLNTLRNMYGKLQVLIIDEISMVSPDFLYKIHRRLNDIKGCSGEQLLLGSTSVLAVGDLYQLPPVQSLPIFRETRNDYTNLTGNIWKDNFQMIELVRPMRQMNDQRFAELLNRVRTSSCTQEDIDLLKTREISENMENYPYDATHLFAQNKDVDQFNDMMLERTCDNIFTIKAIETKRKGLKNASSRTQRKPLESVLRIGVGAKVYVTTNLNVEEGITNGSMASVRGIIHEGEDVKCVIVQFDDPTVGRDSQRKNPFINEYPGCVMIERIDMSYTIGRKKGLENRIQNFPLKLCYATTVHKVQGKTLQKVVLSMKGRYQSGQAYVGLSRCKTLETLYILNFCPSKIRTDRSVDEEMERLRKNMVVIEDCSNKMERENCIAFCHLNVRSVRGKAEDLLLDECVQKADILSLVETFLYENEEIPLIRKDSDMIFMRRERSNVTGLENISRGGILLGMKMFLCPTPLPQTWFEGMEAVGACVCLSDSSRMNVISIYLRPNRSKNDTLCDMRRIVTNIDEDITTVIMGDMNFDSLTEDSKFLVEFMQENGYHQIVYGPTHDSGSGLDHVYFKGNIDEIETFVKDCYFSDHDNVIVLKNAQ